MTVPDLPGCFSAIDTLEEAKDQARAAIMLYVEELLKNWGQFPIIFSTVSPRQVATWRLCRRWPLASHGQHPQPRHRTSAYGVPLPE
ncbi:MAG: type II toxin-antitoxin system HicB family antitoxin [Burkholderiaceae bacterium]|nr:type II toxin-antitoxin system HicB family antitoxin [Burkholderiaceae bacterium]